MFFVGQYELTIDAKNRLSVPHAIRSKMNCDTDGRSFYVLPGERAGMLAIYADLYFERSVRNWNPREANLSREGHAWRRFELSQAALLDPDSQGRILIPDRLLKRCGMKDEVTLIGVQDHLELWDREAYNRFQDEHWTKYDERRERAMDEYRNLPIGGEISVPKA